MSLDGSPRLPQSLALGRCPEEGEPMSEDAKLGELFSRLYVERGAPVQDKPAFRTRLIEEIRTIAGAQMLHELVSYMRSEGGKEVSIYGVLSYLKECHINDFLDCITLLWRAMRRFGHRIASDRWFLFVERAIQEENMAYSLDERCGVHFFVDEEFERNRVSALKCLSGARYIEVAKNFEEAHGHLDKRPPDAEASVTSAFKALESMARLTTSRDKSSMLGRPMVRDFIKPLMVKKASGDIEKGVVSCVADGIAEIVHSAHDYRHGQTTPVDGDFTFTYAVFFLSFAASFLRWLAELDETRAS